MEQRCQAGDIDLYYGDETQVSEAGYVPYGWQYRDEKVCVAVAKGRHLNCFGMLSSTGQHFVYQTTTQTITSDFVIAQLDHFSFTIKKHTVIVLDNARVHQCRQMRERQGVWARRNLFVFFLPPYSPHLNKIERLWKELKARWLRPQDYNSDQQLFYATTLILQAVGKHLFLHFKSAI